MKRQRAHQTNDQTNDRDPSSKAGEREQRAEPFPYGDYVAARNEIETVIRRGPFYALLSGPSGSGKTSIQQELKESLDPHQHPMLYLSSSRTTLLGVARFVAQSFHVTPRRSHLETTHHLAEALKALPGHLIIWIDEAHNVPPETLNELRILAESESDARRLFSLVFSGLPEIQTILGAHRFFPLKRRIVVNRALTGLRRDELVPFLEHRFGSKGLRRIPGDWLDGLFERTQAIPALLDSVIQYVLDRAGSRPLTESMLREAYDALGI